MTRKAAVVAALSALVASVALGACRHSPSDLESGRPSATASALPPAPSLRLRMPLDMAEQPSRAVGEVASGPDYDLRVVDVVRCELRPEFPVREGHVRFGVRVEIVSRGPMVPVNPFYGRIKTAEGDDVMGTFGGCLPSLPNRLLDEDQKLSGYITFELPTTSHGLVFEYRPTRVGRTDAALRFRVELP